VNVIFFHLSLLKNNIQLTTICLFALLTAEMTPSGTCRSILPIKIDLNFGCKFILNHWRKLEIYFRTNFFICFHNGTTDKRPYSPKPINVNCRLKYFVTLVTYCYNNVFVYINLQLTLTGVGEYGPKTAINKMIIYSSLHF
jgi:hypothetical protein